MEPKSDGSPADKENDEPGIGRLAYGYPDPDELHKLLDEAEVSRKISNDSGVTWRTYSVAERLKILVGGYKLAERELAEAEQREPSKLAKILAEARARDEYRQESERLNAPSAAQVGREDLRILWKQIAARHAFAHNQEYLNEGSLDALIEFARIAAVALSAPSAGGMRSAAEWDSLHADFLSACSKLDSEREQRLAYAGEVDRLRAQLATLSATERRQPLGYMIASIESLKCDGMKSEFFKGVNDGLDRALEVVRAFIDVPDSCIDPSHNTGGTRRNNFSTKE